MICLEVHTNNTMTPKNSDNLKLVSDSIKHETVKFFFGNEWEKYQKTAVFSAEGLEPINIVLNKESPYCISEDQCYIPFEVLKGDYFKISVFGVFGESLATTNNVEVTLLKSGYEEGVEPQEPTKSEYSQIIEIVEKTKKIAQSVRDDADRGLLIANDFGENIPLEYVNQNFANAIRVTKSGPSIIINDVSPIKHKLKVSLQSETLSDFSNVTVLVYNLENTLLQSVSANKDGTVEGITSVSPNMIISTDTEGVDIECQYNTDPESHINETINKLAVLKTEFKKLVLNTEHPVGSIYLASDVNELPAVLFGGVWERQIVRKTVASKLKIVNFEANTRHTSLIEGLNKYKLYDGDYSVSVSPLSAVPNIIDIAPNNITLKNGYIDTFDIVSYRTNTTEFTAFWSIIANSDFDENGYYHWKRIS